MSFSKTMRQALIAAALGAASAPILAAIVLPVFSAGSLAQTAPANGISIDNFTFSPPKLTVKAGTKVSWTNRDDIPHGIAWVKNIFARSQAMDTNDNTSVTFTTPGTYQYFCYIHPHMTGTIVVEAATGSNATR